MIEKRRFYQQNVKSMLKAHLGNAEKGFYSDDVWNKMLNNDFMQNDG